MSNETATAPRRLPILISRKTVGATARRSREDKDRPELPQRTSPSERASGEDTSPRLGKQYEPESLRPIAAKCEGHMLMPRIDLVEGGLHRAHRESTGNRELRENHRGHFESHAWSHIRSEERDPLERPGHPFF